MSARAELRPPAHRPGAGVRAAGRALAAVCALLMPACGPGAPARAPDEQPNVILILADDLGWAEPSCYGNQELETPALDRLARDGVRFTDFHASSPVCAATRLGLLTGRYQQRAGGMNGNTVENVHQPSFERAFEALLPRALRDAGYTTALIGKWHLGHGRFGPMRHGFDRFRGFLDGMVDYVTHVAGNGRHDWWHDETNVREEGYTTHLLTRHALRFIQDHREQPFFLYLSHAAPHKPFQGPGDRPVITEGREGGVVDPRTDVAQVYADMVRELDLSVGEILDALEALALERHTVVVFLSDNGPGEHGRSEPFRGRKGTLFEGGQRVPAMIRWPGRIAPQRVSATTLSSLDLMPTILELAGAAAPAQPLDGRALTGLLLDGSEPEPRALFWEHAQAKGGLWRAMRDRQWKLILGPDGQEPRLYDLSADRSERVNRATAFPQRTEAMTAATLRWRASLEADAHWTPGN